MKSLRFILVFLFLIALPLAAEEGWVPMGPPGGHISLLLVHPRNPQILWAGTPSYGVYKSTDGGASWTPANQGLDRWEIKALAVAPGEPRTLYAVAGGRVHRSTDGGQTWVVVLPCGDDPLPCCGCAPLARVLELVVHPRDPRTVFAATHRGLFLSVDGGARWRKVPVGTGLISSLVFEPGRAKVLYAAGEGKVFKSTDGGSSWRRWSRSRIEVNVQRLVIDRVDPRRMWTGGPSGPGVYRSTDGGVTWRISRGLPNPRAEALALASASGAGLPTVWVGNADGLFRSLDGGVTWQLTLRSRSVAAIAAHPGQPDALWVGTRLMQRSASGIFKSVDRGATWTFSSRGIFHTETYFLAFDPVTPGILWAVAQTGIWRSADGGSTWTERTGNLPPDLFLSVLAVDPDDPETVWVGTDNGVFVTEDGGVRWEARREGLSASPDSLPFGRVYFLRLDPSDPSIAYAGCNPKIVVSGSAPRMFKTVDAGRSWGQVASAPPLLSAVLDLWIDPRDPDVLFAAWGGLWVSRDGGASWTRVPVGETVSFSSVQGDPQDPDVLYVLSDRGLFRSADGGQVWHPVEPPLNPENFAVGPAGEVWVGSSDRISVSPDGLTGWTPLPELPGRRFLLAADPHHPGTVFANAVTTNARGVFIGLFRHAGDRALR